MRNWWIMLIPVALFAIVYLGWAIPQWFEKRRTPADESDADN
jgi:hypothetical protein